MEAIKYYLVNGNLRSDNWTICAYIDRICGTHCAMFELRQGKDESGRDDGKWRAVLHCCKRVIKLDIKEGYV